MVDRLLALGATLLSKNSNGIERATSKPVLNFVSLIFRPPTARNRAIFRLSLPFLGQPDAQLHRHTVCFPP